MGRRLKNHGLFIPWKKRKHYIVLWVALGLTVAIIVIAMLVLHGGNKLGDSVAAYADFINSIEESDGNLRFVLGYIDDDDIPELMFCYGNSHPEGVRICSFNQDSGAIEVLGEFSSFGTFDYYERQDVVVSQYGGMGFWYHIYEQPVASGEGNILAVEGTWGTEDGIQYFWRSDLGGDRDDFEQNYKSYSVSETEYTKNLEGLYASLRNAVEITVDYDDMIEFTPENLHTAFQELNNSADYIYIQ